MWTSQSRAGKPFSQWPPSAEFFYLALPRGLVIGPTWLLPTVIAVLLAPTS
jgi:hypothetical protein